MKDRYSLHPGLNRLLEKLHAGGSLSTDESFVFGQLMSVADEGTDNTSSDQGDLPQNDEYLPPAFLVSGFATMEGTQRLIVRSGLPPDSYVRAA